MTNLLIISIYLIVSGGVAFEPITSLLVTSLMSFTHHIGKPLPVGVVNYAKRFGRKCMIFKMGLEKAYDCVSWGFLDYMLDSFGFCEK